MLGLNLWYEIGYKITTIPGHTRNSIRPFYGNRFYVSDVHSKEGYQAIGPASRRARPAWPSVVMEVGSSEALEFLRLDAKWWLINSAGNTRFVMLVQLMTDPFGIHIRGSQTADSPRFKEVACSSRTMNWKNELRY